MQATHAAATDEHRSSSTSSFNPFDTTELEGGLVTVCFLLHDGVQAATVEEGLAAKLFECGDGLLDLFVEATGFPSGIHKPAACVCRHWCRLAIQLQACGSLCESGSIGLTAGSKGRSGGMQRRHDNGCTPSVRHSKKHGAGHSVMQGDGACSDSQQHAS